MEVARSRGEREKQKLTVHLAHVDSDCSLFLEEGPTDKKYHR